ncbi:thioredoxin family protein [Streptococcus sp. NLN76]|uniref:thioredoxin family protein n=1 Tax=Streptococcus sp. NLN76 TaxID=2822800 RepID=UPI0018AA6C44|nr:thioredoxin family protein [Streptococcus sp. NLN76]MBF8970454.1 thiol reductase thioredoxin [Streptococcus sp. NLN76]
MDFYQVIAPFELVLTKDVEERIESGEELVLFVGRATCPYSRLFAPKLAQVQAELGLEVAFLDSENPEDLGALQVFRAQYQIVTVPGLLVAKDKQVRVVCDSSLSPEEIKAFIAQGK